MNESSSACASDGLTSFVRRSWTCDEHAPRHRRQRDERRSREQRPDALPLAPRDRAEQRDGVEHQAERDRVALRRERRGGEHRRERELVRAEQQHGADEETRERNVRVLRERLVARGGHPEQEAEPGRQRPRGHVRPEHVPGDERQARRGTRGTARAASRSSTRPIAWKTYASSAGSPSGYSRCTGGAIDASAKLRPAKRSFALSVQFANASYWSTGFCAPRAASRTSGTAEHEQRPELDPNRRREGFRTSSPHTSTIAPSSSTSGTVGYEAEVDERRQQHHRSGHSREDRRDRASPASASTAALPRRAERARPERGPDRRATASQPQQPVVAVAPGAPRVDARLARRPADEHDPRRPRARDDEAGRDRERRPAHPPRLDVDPPAPRHRRAVRTRCSNPPARVA